MMLPNHFKLILSESELNEIYSLCLSKFAYFESILESNPEDCDSNVGCVIIGSILDKIDIIWRRHYHEK